MSFHLANPLALAALAGTAAYLMTYAGIGKKRLTIRGKTCPSCHHRFDRCACRWR